MPGILGNRAGTGRLQPWKGGQRDGYIMSIGYYDVVKSSVAYLGKKNLYFALRLPGEFLRP